MKFARLRAVSVCIARLLQISSNQAGFGSGHPKSYTHVCDICRTQFDETYDLPKYSLITNEYYKGSKEETKAFKAKKY